MISNWKPQQARILKSKATKSYFTFLSPESMQGSQYSYIAVIEHCRNIQFQWVTLTDWYKFVIENEDIHYCSLGQEPISIISKKKWRNER